MVACDADYVAARDQAQATMRRITSELARLAQRAADDAQRLLANARRVLRRAQTRAMEWAAAGMRDAAAGRRRGRLRRAIDELANLLEESRQIAAQTRQRVAVSPRTGSACTMPRPGPSPRTSWVNRSSFGYKARVIDNDDGVVPDYSLQLGNPPDAPQLVPGDRAGRPPYRSTPAHRYH